MPVLTRTKCVFLSDYEFSFTPGMSFEGEFSEEETKIFLEHCPLVDDILQERGVCLIEYEGDRWELSVPHDESGQLTYSRVL